MDITDASDAELSRLKAMIEAELERRKTIATAQLRMDEISSSYLTATGVSPGQEWRQPTGAHDAYPVDWTVSHNGKEWVSLISGNVWEPGVSGWRESSSGVPEWIQPTGAHDAYNTGDLVLFEDVEYESLIDGNVWSPRDYPAGWSARG